MVIKNFILGSMATNCYIVYGEAKKAGVLIDPAVFESKILDYINYNHLKIEYILLTHGHFDHISGVAKFAKELGAKIAMHQEDESLWQRIFRETAPLFGYRIEHFKADLFLKDGQIIKVGDLAFKVIHTPGHSPGGISFCLARQKVLFSGDTLFAGSYGRTDLPGGDEEKIFTSLKKLLNLPPETKVYPGHGDETTVEGEKLIYNL